MVEFGLGFLRILFSFGALFFKAWVMATCWNWHMVTFLTFMPVMTVPIALGLMFTLMLFNGTFIPNGTIARLLNEAQKDNEEGDKWLDVVIGYTVPAMILLFAWGATFLL